MNTPPHTNVNFQVFWHNEPTDPVSFPERLTLPMHDGDSSLDVWCRSVQLLINETPATHLPWLMSVLGERITIHQRMHVAMAGRHWLHGLITRAELLPYERMGERSPPTPGGPD